ncbi:NADH-quinone oxidoreductase subunit N [Helicobacter sp. 16-1353]|uniref:NADH-quinone oxidoreductase subunit NuoN n=1 Tax=Helicobacter sp. 16-1353 TaxID=2004996 RepID=UPI000DCD0268|nr:NADH-quinone oxidoreductase subunit NuoN [Helicobacter sp. 16-1353]RAX54925.1 NADH-quinone oxidoreductase subunit N [Helicobacter sp. 16-1353]
MPDLSFSALNVTSILPMAINVIGGIIILIIDLFLKKPNKALYIILSSIFILLSLLSLLYMNSTAIGFFDLVIVDGLAVLSQIIILVASLLFIFFLISKDRFPEFECGEFYILFLFMIAGYQFMVSSDNLILIFLGLESSSLALYALVALSKKQKALEAGIKYFTLGALGSGFFAFGLMFIYASSGSVDIFDLSTPISGLLVLDSSGNEYFLSLGFIFLLGAIGFKLSFFPFHTWVPDVYEGSTPPLAFYMSIATKIAGFVVAIRLFNVFLNTDIPFISVALFVIVILSMTIPNIIALLQTDVQRMLAYSSISQAGFGLACIYINTEQSMVALFLYWILFLFTNLGAFGLLWLTHNKNKTWDSRFTSPYTKFSGLVKLSPIIAVSFGIFMLSLGGIPPFGLFWGKLYLISSSVNAGHNILALILLLNSAIAIYYYIKLIVFMFLKEPITKDSGIYHQNASYPMIGIIAIALIVSIFAIFFIEGFLGIITNYLFNF